MSLESCIRKAGKALSKEDAAAIRALRDDIYDAGKIDREQANEQAVAEYIDILVSEKMEIMSQIEGLGGVPANPALQPSEFALQAKQRIEKAAKAYPQKGLRRPDPLAVQDTDTGLIERLYPDFFSMDRDKVIQITSKFDPDSVAALKGMKDDSLMRLAAAESILDWVQKEGALPFRFSVSDPVEREFVDANPNSPIAATTKLGAVLERAEKAKPVGIEKIKNWVMDTGSITVKSVLGGVPQTKLKDFIKSGMESLRQYTRTVKEMDAWMNRLMEGTADLANEWLDFNSANTKGAKILGEFMHASTLSGIDVPTFQMPSAADLKEMSEKQRELWANRARDYKILKPFWDRLGKMGDPTTYQQQKYNPLTGKFENSGNPVEVSKAQYLYLTVRDSYANQRTMLIENLEKRIMETEASEQSKSALLAKLRKEFEAGLITPYFPLSRFGKYQATAKDPETGETVAYIKRETRRERNAWVEAMRAEGFNVVGFEEVDSDLDLVGKIDPQFAASVVDLLEETQVVRTDPVTGEQSVIKGSQIQDTIWQMYLRTLPDMSARKAYIHRKGRLGFTHDALRSFSDHSFHGIHQMAKLRFGYELSEHLRDATDDAKILVERPDKIRNMMENNWRPVGYENASEHDVLMNTSAGGIDYRVLYDKFKKEAGDTSAFHEPSYIKARDKLLQQAEADAPWAVPLANELIARHGFNMNPKSAGWSTKLTALGFFWFLSTSPAAGVLNLTQTPIFAYPILRAKFSGMGAGMELLRASKDYAGGVFNVDKLTNNLKGDEARAIEEFRSIGMFAKTRTRELLGLSDAGSEYSMRQERFMETVGWIFHKTEEANRAVTALAAYRLARKKLESNKGMSAEDKHLQAILDAEELVEASHFDYTNTNRPRFMQGDATRVLFLFRNYSVNATYRLMRDFRDGVWKNENISKADRKEARSQLLGIIGMTTLFAGVAGWPMFWAVESIAGMLLGDDDEPFDLKDQGRKLVFDATSEYLGEVWGEKIATAVMKGPWSELTSADLSMRASLNNLWIREVPPKVQDDPRGLLLHLAGEALGPIYGMAMNFEAGFSDLGSGHPDRALEKFTPKFFGDYMKAYRYATQGAQTYSRDVIMPPESFNEWDLFLQASGFMPTELSNRYDQGRATKNIEQKLKGRRDDLVNKLFTSWKLEDRASAKRTLKEMAEWNKANPRYQIDSDTIKKSAESRARYDMRTVGGVSVDKRLQYLHNETRFTAWPYEKDKKEDQ